MQALALQAAPIAHVSVCLPQADRKTALSGSRAYYGSDLYRKAKHSVHNQTAEK